MEGGSPKLRLSRTLALRSVGLEGTIRRTRAVSFRRDTVAYGAHGKIQSDLDLSRSSKLRMLSLRGDWDFYNSLLPFAINCRTTLPSLTTLELDLVGDKEGFSSSNQCIRLLGNAPNLHTLTVRSMSGYTSPSAQLLRLENVRKLRVIAAAVQLGTIRNFLYRIKCPRLQQLVVQTVNDEGSDEPVNGFMLDIQGLLQRSKCTLEVLKIRSRLIQ